MSNYTSDNTIVLATHDEEQLGTRMLLLHQFTDSGRFEFVIGSYFAVEDRGEYKPKHYSWHWGHYFDDVVHAVDYWKREVVGEDTDRFMCPDCSGVYQEHPVELVRDGEWWTCPECGCSTAHPEEDLCIRIGS